MEERLILLLAHLRAAIDDFEGSLAIDEAGFAPVVLDTIHNGQVLKFEFTVELCWKTLKLFLYSEHGFDLASPKAVVKKYFELGYVNYDDCARLLRALDIRNTLSHVYDKGQFAALHDEVREFRGLFGKVAMATKN